jgi:hypothetical protein
LRAKRVTIPRPALVIQPPVRSVGTMGSSLGERTDRPLPGPEPAAKARGARASFVLRRLRSARLLPASLLLAILTSTMVTVGLASFGARALPAAEHRRLANVSDATIEVSGQVGTARADADARGIRSRSPRPWAGRLRDAQRPLVRPAHAAQVSRPDQAPLVRPPSSAMSPPACS